MALPRRPPPRRRASPAASVLRVRVSPRGGVLAELRGGRAVAGTGAPLPLRRSTRSTPSPGV
eukprot:5022701-Alexandrium_andersonii.AAC.1